MRLTHLSTASSDVRKYTMYAQGREVWLPNCLRSFQTQQVSCSDRRFTATGIIANSLPPLQDGPGSVIWGKFASKFELEIMK
jgi:hypothetical protein